jgi:hypothetical protein
MAHQKIKYTLITLLLVFIFSESCTTNSRGLFEKRKHLKGWHFHKKNSVSQNASNDVEFKQKSNDLNVRAQTNYSMNINPLQIRKPRFVNTNTVEKELVGFRSSSNNRAEKLQKNRSKQRRDPTKLVEEETGFKSNNSPRKTDSSSQINGAYFFLLMLFPLAFNNNKRKQVQAWAARNKGKSRTLLVVAKILLAATSMGLGFLVGVPFSLPLLLLSVGLPVLSLVLSNFWKSNGKMTQKRNLGILGAVNTSTSFGFFSLGGMLANGFRFSEWSLNSGVLNFSSTNPENELVNSPVYIIAGIILLTVLLVALLAFVGWTSCNVYCSTSEALGIIIFAIGYFVFIFGFVYLIQKLFERENDTDKSRKLKLAAITSSIIVVLLTLYISFFGFP